MTVRAVTRVLLCLILNCIAGHTLLTCDELETLLETPKCPVSFDSTVYITIMDCSEDLSYDLATEARDIYIDVTVQLVCINTVTSEIHLETIKTFGLFDDFANQKVTNFHQEYSHLFEDPNIECSLQGCGNLKRKCQFNKFKSTRITCYDVISNDDMHTSSAGVQVSSSIDYLTSIVVSPSPSLINHHSSLQNYPIISSDKNEVSSMTEPTLLFHITPSSSVNNNSTNLLSLVALSSAMFSSSLDTHSSHSIHPTISSFAIRTPAVSDNAVNKPISAGESKTIVTQLVLVAVILPVAFVWILCFCILIFLGCSLHTKFFRKKDEVTKTEECDETKEMGYDTRHADDTCSIGSVKTIIHELSIPNEGEIINDINIAELEKCELGSNDIMLSPFKATVNNEKMHTKNAIVQQQTDVTHSSIEPSTSHVPNVSLAEESRNYSCTEETIICSVPTIDCTKDNNNTTNQRQLFRYCNSTSDYVTALQDSTDDYIRIN